MVEREEEASLINQGPVSVSYVRRYDDDEHQHEQASIVSTPLRLCER